MTPSPNFAVTCYPARLGPAQRLRTASAIRLMEWCAGVCRKGDYGLSLVLADPDLLAWMGCSYRTAQRALRECVDKGWLVEAHYDGRVTTARLGEMYGARAAGGQASEAVAVAVYEQALGVRLSAANREALSGAVGAGEVALKTLRRACGKHRKEQGNFHDVGAVVRTWQAMMVLTPVTGHHGQGAPTAPVTPSTAMEWGG